jgi:hypothetical protein
MARIIGCGGGSRNAREVMAAAHPGGFTKVLQVTRQM